MDDSTDIRVVTRDGYIPNPANANPKSGHNNSVSRGYVPTAATPAQLPPKVVYNQPSSIQPPKK